MLRGRTIVVGVSGGIAAYKACELVRQLQSRGATVVVVMTRAATEFVTPLTFQALTGNPVVTTLWGDQAPAMKLPAAAALRTGGRVEHVDVAEAADALVLAPATADLMARIVHGEAPDALTSIVLAVRAPLIVCPSMDLEMWRQPATQANVRALRSRGAVIVGPEIGPLASGLSGKGRLPEVERIVEALLGALSPARDLESDHVLVTAGPTREPIDPVRYISNRSSGKMGYSLAAAALRRGARVTLVSGPTALTPPAGAVFVPVQTAEEMREAVLQHLAAATVVIKAAAVGDYRVRHVAPAKIKGKRDVALELTPNPDILAEVAARRTGAFVVGFAAETHDVAAHARAKLESKGIDLLVANDVSQAGIGFEAEDNEVLLLDRWGGTRALPRMAKGAVADAILGHIVALRARAAGKKTPA